MRGAISEEQRFSALKKLNSITLSKKALSPIFATLIILSVVTILFIPVFIWATGTTSQTQESWETSGLVATERIVVEEVDMEVVPQNCTVYVRNIGTTAVTINNVLIIESYGEVFTYEKIKGELETVDPSSKNIKDSIIQGELIEIDIYNLRGLTLSSNKVYTVKVFTVRGIGDTCKVVT